jgi:predicted amidohydrolase
MSESKNVADLFAELWCALQADAAELQNQNWYEADAYSPALDDVIAEFNESYSYGATGRVDGYLSQDAAVPKGWVHGSFARRRLFVARAIDAWFLKIHPRSNARDANPDKGRDDSDAMRFFRELQYRFGHFNSNPTLGLVVPRAPLRESSSLKNGDEWRPGAENNPVHIQNQFKNLTVVFQSTQRFSRSFKPLTPAHLRTLRASPLRIGVVPLAEKFCDLDFNFEERQNCKYVKISPVDEEKLAERAKSAVKDLIDENAHIAVLPEFCVTKRILDTLRRELRSHKANLRQPSSLRLVFAGSGLRVREVYGESTDPDRPGYNNVCTVLDGSGNILWEQLKTFSSPVSRVKLHACGLEVQGDISLHEEGVGGTVIQFADIPSVGRFVVLVCEDLDFASRDMGFLGTGGVDWIVSPICDAGIAAGNWVQQASMRLSQTYGCRVLVANSMALSDTVRETVNSGIALCSHDVPRQRRVKIIEVPIPPTQSPVKAVIDWPNRPTDWPQAEIGLNQLHEVGSGHSDR